MQWGKLIRRRAAELTPGVLPNVFFEGIDPATLRDLQPARCGSHISTQPFHQAFPLSALGTLAFSHVIYGANDSIMGTFSCSAPIARKAEETSNT